MNQSRITPSKPGLAGCDTRPGSPQGGARATVADVACPLETPRPRTIRPRWLAILGGRLALRVCPSGKRTCEHERCHLRVLCKCAAEEFETATKLEHRLWGVIAVCGAAAIAYWLWWS